MSFSHFFLSKISFWTLVADTVVLLRDWLFCVFLCLRQATATETERVLLLHWLQQDWHHFLSLSLKIIFWSVPISRDANNPITVVVDCGGLCSHGGLLYLFFSVRMPSTGHRDINWALCCDIRRSRCMWNNTQCVS